MAGHPRGGGCWGGWGRIALGGVAGRRAEPYPYIYIIMIAYIEHARFQPFGCGQKKIPRISGVKIFGV